MNKKGPGAGRWGSPDPTHTSAVPSPALSQVQVTALPRLLGLTQQPGVRLLRGWNSPGCDQHAPLSKLLTRGSFGGLSPFLCHCEAPLGSNIFQVQVDPDLGAALVLNWFSDGATLNMIQEKLPEPPLHLSLEMVFVLRSFASDTPSPQLPQLLYLSLSGTRKGEAADNALVKSLVGLELSGASRAANTPRLHCSFWGDQPQSVLGGFKYGKGG